MGALRAGKRPYALVKPHVGVQEARLLHGEVVADGDVALQSRRAMLQLQDRHARSVHGLDLHKLARRLERLECHREMTNERLLLDVRWRTLSVRMRDERDVEVRTIRVQLACGRAEQQHRGAGHCPPADRLQPRQHQVAVAAIPRDEPSHAGPCRRLQAG
eukprot:scaffold22225_cov72-Phaeocystis_antarctica.AAC.3